MQLFKSVSLSDSFCAGQREKLGNTKVQVLEISLINRRLDSLANLAQKWGLSQDPIISGVLEGVFYHQGLLLTSSITENNNDKKQYHICEYFDDGKVYLTLQNCKKNNDEKFKPNDCIYEWKKELNNYTAPKSTVQQIKQQMEQVAKKQDYSIINHNCRHVAKEVYDFYSSKYNK